MKRVSPVLLLNKGTSDYCDSTSLNKFTKMAVAEEKPFQALQGLSQSQIQSAGARYTPGIDPDAPNIINDELFHALDNLVCGKEFYQRLTDMSKRLSDAWRDSKFACDEPEKIDPLVAAIPGKLSRVQELTLRGQRDGLTELTTDLQAISRALLTEEGNASKKAEAAEEKFQKRAKVQGQEDPGYSQEVSQLRSKFTSIRRMVPYVQNFIEDLDGVVGKLLTDRVALLRGHWGTGKTHLLCDYAAKRLREARPVLLVIARNFQDSKGILDGIATSAKLSDFQAVISKLEEWSEIAGERAIILVDGVNEGPREAWKEAIDELVQAVSQRSNIALMISCRIPFDEIALSPNLQLRITKLDHSGFSDHEFDAQAEFFRYYKIPLPEVPLLNDEFSRPLTLKLICEAFHDLRTQKMKEGFFGIASGQKGMTFVLESLVKRVGAPIERQFGLKGKACWNLLKGVTSISESKRAGFAPYMASTLKDYIGRRSALGVIKAQCPSLSPKQRSRLLDLLRINGLIDEDVIWKRKDGKMNQQIVYRLPYQRFSDHLIARHLLDRFVDKSTPTTILGSFRLGSPLGRVFRKRKHWGTYAMPGWAEALIVEFPESVKRKVPDNDRELFNFLPRSGRDLNKYHKPFLDGLFWRSPEAFTTATGRIVGVLVSVNHKQVWEHAVDVLVALSIKPRHPYSAARLHRWLSRYEMAERDKWWSEYLRNSYETTSVRRLLHWAERIDTAHLTQETAAELIVLLSLLLTTVVRRDRDIVTRALVIIGEKYPDLVFAHVIRSLEFNDPYVPERMLAVAYGVALSQWSMRNRSFRKQLTKTARELYRAMFAPGAKHATHHALSRDYAANFIKLAIRLKPDLLSSVELPNINPPFNQIGFSFPPADDISDEECKDGKSAIHMDFGNYTIGRLVKGRANYDDSNPTYTEVRRQIEWRIGNLGYKEEAFKEIDKAIAQHRYYEEQRGEAAVDRYGKKYSWIAYFEMYGYREVHGLLEEYRLDERTSDCDIDPSFPLAPPSWEAPIPNIFGDESLSDEEWLRRGHKPDFRPLLKVQEINGHEGPWILMNGYVAQENKELNRELFAFLRGLFVKKSDIDRLKTTFLEIEYPGNEAIPTPAQEYYLYAAEAGTDIRYCPHLKMKNGRYRRQLVSTFERWEKIAATEEDDESSTVLIKEGETIKFRIPAKRHKYRMTAGIKVELPTRSFSWESYHSDANQLSGFSLLAPRIVQELNLKLQNREIDYRDQLGRYAALYRTEGEGWRGNQFHLFYLREDLLKAYLNRSRLKLVWCNWGERDWLKDDVDKLVADARRSAIMQKHQHIHKQFVTLDGL